jgi:hypothetical protein
MKKIIISVGLAAAGTAAFQMKCAAQADSMETTPKDWNVSASLRGFYDDNYTTSVAGNRRGSAGAEFSPTVSASVPYTQTEIGFLYSYDLQYYQERNDLGQNPYDQSHMFNLWVDHSFNERWQAKFNDSFVVGQEPELLQAGSAGASPTYQRLEGNNIANNASIQVNHDLSREFSVQATYANYFADYSQKGAGLVLGGVGALANEEDYLSFDGINHSNQSSYAGELNRDQNSIDLEFQWHLAPETMVGFGYQFIDVDYTGNEPIAGFQPEPDGGFYKGSALYSKSRDNYSHIGYLLAQHNILPNLVAAAKAGIQYVDYYNSVNPYNINPTTIGTTMGSTSVSPYADVSLIYTYIPGCNAQVGFTQMRNATDVTSVDANGKETLDQESSSVHASINHHFTPKFLGSVIASWTASTFNGGADNNQTDKDLGLGLSANYTITRNISGEIDYNYDDLQSGIVGRGYYRNRISLGLSVAY